MSGLWVSLFLALIPYGYSFNIAPSKNADITPPSPYPTDAKVPGYFGYKFLLDSSKLTIGAPKLVDAANLSLQATSNASAPTPAKGGIFDCGVTSVFSTSSSPTSNNCGSISDPSSSPGDSFGQTIARSPNGLLKACSPAKVQNCPKANYMPGYCFNRAASGWQKDEKTAGTTCSFLKLDMFLLLDGSFSLGLENFRRIQAWTKDVVSNFELASGNTQVGVIEYSKYYPSQDDLKQSAIRTYVQLGECKDHICFNDKVDRMFWFRSQTDTSKALNITVKNFMLSSRFNDPSVAKVLVLLTDGASTDRIYLRDTANYVRSLGITTFAVGVGDADVGELKTIATGTNSKERVYYVSNFTSLDSVVGTLRSAIRELSLEGGLAVNGSSSFDTEMGEYGSSMHYSTGGKRRLGYEPPPTRFLRLPMNT